MADMIQESEVTAERLENLFKAAFVPCSRDPGGVLRVDEDGVKNFVAVDMERKLIVLSSVWAMRKSVTVEKKLQWINDLNGRLVLVRFRMVHPERLLCEYQLRYEGGLDPQQFISTVRLFGRVCRGAAAQNDPDRIIGAE